MRALLLARRTSQVQHVRQLHVPPLVVTIIPAHLEVLPGEALFCNIPSRDISTCTLFLTGLAPVALVMAHSTLAPVTVRPVLVLDRRRRQHVRPALVKLHV